MPPIMPEPEGNVPAGPENDLLGKLHFSLTRDFYLLDFQHLSSAPQVHGRTQIEALARVSEPP
jgi:hypothetical protein